jgi:5-methylcytosine-specific restriction endonuclease McrA
VSSLRYSCSYPTCPTKLPYPGRRCAEHGGSKRPHHSNYTGAWPGIRAQQLRDHPTCRVCGQPATEVDHITPLTPVPGSGLAPGTHDQANLQSLCHAHAREKTGIENQIRFGRGRGMRASA